MNGEFVCFLEEESAEAMLRVIIPKLTDINPENVRYVRFSSKQALEKRVRQKLAGYQKPNSVFLIMCDKDHADCEKLKNELLEKIAKDKKAKTKVKVRIACHELESFYLGDLQAVEKGLGIKEIKLSRMQGKKPYRMPDNQPKPSKYLKEITEYKYQKVAGSRNIAPHLNLRGGNCSKSFNSLLAAIKELAEKLTHAPA